MAAPQVLPQTLLTQQQQQQQLLQLLRRDLNRLSDSNRVTRLQGARSILRVYEEEAAKRAAETDRAATSGDNQKSLQKDHTPQACPFSGVFLSSVYAPISVLCADEASESCRATALDLVQLVVKHFLSRREVILICMGSKDTGDNTYPWGGDCNSCPVGAAFFRGRAGAADGSYLSSSSAGHSEAVKSLVLVIAERLKDASGEVEKSEELRLINMQLLQYLLLQAANRYWNVSLAAWLDLNEQSDGLKMVQMLRRLVQEMSPRVLLRRKVLPNLLQLLLLLMGDADQEVAREAEEALLSLAPRCVSLSRKREQRREWRREKARSQSQKLSSEEDELTNDDTGSSDDLLEENEDDGPHKTSRIPLSPCEADDETSELYKSTGYCREAPTELAGLYLKELMADLLPRLTSWSADERLASLRALAALMPMSGFRLLHQLPHLLMQLYETCAIGEGRPPGNRQDEQHQWSPLLLLVQHAILREIKGENEASNDCNSTNVSEPWHRGGLQELGACSSLCNSLEAVELALQCAGQLLHAARELCQVEAKSLFAAALLQQIDTRSHQDIAREAVACVCECTGEGPLKLYLAFLDDLIARELHGDFAREESASPPSPMMQARPSLPMLWSSNDPRRLLLLRALHGAQEAADAEEVSSAANCLRMRDLVKVALLCVSQIIPTLSPSSIPPVPTPHQQTEEGHENPSNGDVNEMGTFGQLTPANERKAEFDAVSKETNENEVQAKPLIAALSLLSPLLVSCMDDDWNADVRSLSVGVVRQLFLDLHGAGEEHAALEQLAAATATPLQQRLDDARDDIRLAAAVALQAMLKQRPLIINRSAATEICKSLCICLDDRSELLAAAAEAALLAGPDDLYLYQAA
ncbi:LOW QUALITY PROTEIN: uncharacterized protein EMH_0002080 [Eimeria mitis]|uniref:HEAT repeat-containing protein n=1 Tax=Eimeria mitis TaxID=44415 RepID=U6KDB0_9EIME|nr:LOW QUALITY PROTEIN: uncharacterized protein EMH_0002080 [Eimeria mitis]CDJ35914.1 hypothetical protein, conserved [Eimeria mitis]